MTHVIDGRALSYSILRRVKKRVEGFSRPPVLAVVLAGNDPGSLVYIENKKKACEETGIELRLYALGDDVSQGELTALIDELNSNEGVDGILPQQPLPPHIDTNEITRRVDPLKDVDCLHPYNIGLVAAGGARMLPCTPAGVIDMLDEAGVEIEGEYAVVLGRSGVVGKPLASMLTHRNATVTICHSRTRNINEITRRADILVAAIRQPRFVKAEMIKEGSAVIDVGINRLGGKKICGDVDYKDCFGKASFITKVPGGVGPMTVAKLMENCVIAYERGMNE